MACRKDALSHCFRVARRRYSRLQFSRAIDSVNGYSDESVLTMGYDNKS